MSFVNGQGRKPLVNLTTSGVAASSLAFGTFLVSEFAGIAGMVKCDSSFGALLQLAYKMTSGGVTLVTSTLAVGSGIVVNELNPAPYVAIGVTTIQSASPVRCFLTGLPIR